MEEAEVLTGIFTLVCSAKIYHRNPRPLRPMGKSGAMKTYPQKSRFRLQGGRREGFPRTRKSKYQSSPSEEQEGGRIWGTVGQSASLQWLGK